MTFAVQEHDGDRRGESLTLEEKHAPGGVGDDRGRQTDDH
jgi:hypothetical protein